MTGGLGDDIYIVDNAGDRVIETVANPTTGGIDTVRSRITWTLGANVENLILTAAGRTGTGNTLDNLLTAAAGAHTLIGGAGDDTLDCGAGADRMVGGSGDDTYYVDTTGDLVIESLAGLAAGGRGNVIANLNWTLGANLEDLTITAAGRTGTGNALDNVLTGAAGGQLLQGLNGNGSLAGLDGADTLE